jgi:hypothetical protein
MPTPIGSTFSPRRKLRTLATGKRDEGEYARRRPRVHDGHGYGRHQRTRIPVAHDPCAIQEGGAGQQKARRQIEARVDRARRAPL